VPQEHRPTTGGSRATSRGKHHHGPDSVDVLTLGVLLANGHTKHRAGDSVPTQTGDAA
jgi:hypothetical protein